MGTTMMGLQDFDMVLQVGVERELFGAQALITGLTGWYGGGAAVRRPSTPKLNRHGVHAERGWRDARLVSVEGQAWADTRAEAAQLVDDFAAHLADGRAGTITVVDPDQGTRRAQCYLTGTPELDWDTDEGFYFAFDLVCPDPRKYAMEPMTAESGKPVEGGGLIFPLFSAGAPLEVARQYAQNPRAMTSGAGFGVYALGTGEAGTTTWETGKNDGPAGTGLTSYGRFSCTTAKTGGSTGWRALAGAERSALAGVAGEPVIASVYVRYTGAGGLAGRMRTSTYRADASTVAFADAGTVTLQSGVWTRVSMVVTPSEDFVTVGWWFYQTSGSTVPAGATLDATGLMIEPDGTLDTYYDGSTAAAGGFAYDWAGTPDASASVKYELVAGSGVLNFGVPGSDGTGTLTNHGTADTVVDVTVTGPAPEGFSITEIETGRRLVYVGNLAAGQHVDLNGRDGSVLLEGYADRATLLTIREWFTLPAKTSRKYRIEAPSGDPRQLLKAVPAWF